MSKMIIALSTDDATIRAARDLKALYPNERAIRMEQIVDNDYHFSHLQEQPIKRITIIGHTEANRYGGMTAKKFANHLMQIFDTHETLSPGFFKNIEAVDLLGCEVGFVHQNYEGFAAETAGYLQRKGYIIPINSFTNQVTAGHPQLYTTLLAHETAENSWVFSGFTSSNNYQTFQKLTQKHNKIVEHMNEKGEKIYEQMAIKETLQSQNQALQHKIDTFNFNTAAQRPLIPEEEKERFEQEVLKGEAHIRTMKTKITQNSIHIMDAQTEITAINAEIETLNQSRLELIEYRQTFSHRITTTTNPREYFDMHPQCNFTKKQQDTIGLSRAYKRTNVQLKRDKLDPSEHPLYTPDSSRTKH